jgi:RND family efflux transporter MFP subunit
MRHSPIRSVLAALALAAGLGPAGCGKAAPEMTFPPPVVLYTLPVEKEVTDYSEFTGRTAAVETVTVRAHVWGYLDKINFKEGALVEKDAMLFEIDPRTYDTAVKQTEARVKLAETQLTQAQRELDRNVILRNRNSISQEDLEKSMTTRDVAAATVESARADLKRAQLDLEFTKVRAPVAGRVSRALVTRGNLVQSGEMGGTALTTIVSVDPVYAYFDVDDLTSERVKHLLQSRTASEGGPRVELALAEELQKEKRFPHVGAIDFIDNQVDPGTGTLRVRGKFPNPDGALTPGLFAQIHLPLGRPHQALLVPDRAVDTDQGVKVVYIVNQDNVVEKRLVRLGKLHDGLREIERGAGPRDGVRPGERVIVDGIQRVRNGDKADPKPEDATSESNGK